MCIYFMRHGQTNEDLPTNDLVSGWNPVPLNKQGRINARTSAHVLKGRGITSITSSDTPRAAQTAQILCQELGVPVVESPRLRSWNMGCIQGMEHEVAAPFLKFFEEHPTITVPQGEKFETFYNRFRHMFDYFVGYARKFPNAVPLILTHSQNLDLIPWLIKGQEPGRELDRAMDVKPGGILRVDVGERLSVRKLRV